MAVKVARLISGETVVGVKSDYGLEAVCLLTAYSETMIEENREGRVNTRMGNIIVFIKPYMSPYTTEAYIKVPTGMIIAMADPTPLVLGLYQKNNPSPSGLRVIKRGDNLN